MLASVEADNGRYEGLRDYITGNKRPPPFVSASNPNPRLATKPGDPVPGVSGRIPVSSQRPGKRTNETVAYARVVFTEFNNSSADPSNIRPGDIVMLHKTPQCLAHDSNRATKCSTWRQINSVLRRDFGVIGRTRLGVGMKDALLSSRRMFLDGVKKAAEEDSREAQYLASCGRLESEDFKLHNSYIPFLIPVLEDAIATAESNDPAALLVPQYDLFALSFFKEWTPDGILISRDDEHNASQVHAGEGDSGVVLNVAIQGPAYTRNCNIAQNVPDDVQMFDPEPRIRDALYLIVVCYSSNDDAGNFLNYGFQLKPTSARIIDELVRVGNNTSDPDKGYPVDGGLTWNEVKFTVFAWQIGTVMDGNAAGKSRQRLQVNVSVSPLPLYKLWALFTNAVGSGVMPQPVF
jgi:hypothetical protein